jgi:hypothetical protein
MCNKSKNVLITKAEVRCTKSAMPLPSVAYTLSVYQMTNEPNSKNNCILLKFKASRANCHEQLIFSGHQILLVHAADGRPACYHSPAYTR